MSCSRSADLPSALEAIDRLAAAPAHVLFLDYDGTLTPIVSRPQEAVLSPRMREAVCTVAGLCPVVMVSGRERRDLERLVAIPALGYVGSHGFDIKGPAGCRVSLEVAAESLPRLDEAERQLRTALAAIRDAHVERKRFGIAVHFRLVEERDLLRIDAAVGAAVAARPGLRIAVGKKVVELRPDVDWDKGKAVLWLIDAIGWDDALPIHLGDDLTDETVFAALEGRGSGIFVGTDDRPTAATLRLRDAEEVGLFLDRFAARLQTAKR